MLILLPLDATGVDPVAIIDATNNNLVQLGTPNHGLVDIQKVCAKVTSYDVNTKLASLNLFDTKSGRELKQLSDELEHSMTVYPICHTSGAMNFYVNI